MIFKTQRERMKNPWVILMTSVLSFGIAAIIIIRLLDFSAFKDSINQAADEPAQVMIAVGVSLVFTTVSVKLCEVVDSPVSRVVTVIV